ncbi:hypothetical protein MM300_18490 [Evansella sp. LMS18]|jgi:hypothetical protein|uniref:hypothetical protein n=1 Tax=Evansella sp. LMS18 TaxID=2924033 RepID=UPI0020D1128E|nr:hypothetical protein [Evansella sp. LMS18]UTR09851.1 hypothetical protein MM300_18490 [Evansella sp. LMS18]
MIENYRMLTAGGVCLFLSMLFGLSFPHSSPFGELLLRAVGIPTYSNMDTETGIHFAGLTSFFLLLAGLFFVNHSLNKYNGRAVLTALAAVFLLPSALVSAYQATFATGIYGVSYEKDWSECLYEYVEEEQAASIECIIPLKNNGWGETEFEITFVEPSFRDQEMPTYSLLNETGPHIIELYPGENRLIRIKDTVNISAAEDFYQWSQSNYIDVNIKDDRGRERRL